MLDRITRYSNNVVFRVLRPDLVPAGYVLLSADQYYYWGPVPPPAGQALTGADDTNVTITLGGSPTVALLSPTSITIGWTGELATTRGGTGLGSYTQGDLLYYNSGTILSKLAKDTNATRYLSNTGTSNDPLWAQINLVNGITGVLPVANGGTDAWVDYFASSTIVGWGSFTTSILRYQLCYKRVHVVVQISGVSNSTTTSFTLPFAVGSNAPSLVMTGFFGVNNAINGIKRANFTSGSATVAVQNDPTGNIAWTGFGNKRIDMEFFYEID